MKTNFNIPYFNLYHGISVRKVLHASCIVVVFIFTSCSKDEEDSTSAIQAQYTINVNLAQETDWQMANEILQLINEHRATVGLSALKKDPTYASAYAVEHTQYMIGLGQINHDNFGERSNALKNQGAKRVGENVGYGYATAEEVVLAWLNSPGHKNIIEGDYNHTGFGVLSDSMGRYYFTQLFYKK